MSTTPLVQRDERTIAVENASYRWAYLFLSFALLLDVAFRGLIRNEAAWDLMALVIAAGAYCTLYQARLRTLTHGWALKGVLIACVGAIMAAIFAALSIWFRR